MVVGKILVRDYLKEFVAQPAGGPAQLSPVTEEEAEGWYFVVLFILVPVVLL